MELILQAENLTKIHGRGCDLCVASTGPLVGNNMCPHCGSIVACANVSFNLHQGEILGVVGESGSGKSTLVQMLYFDVIPTAGRAIFFEEDHEWDLFSLNAAAQRQLRNRRFGMVYQNPRLGLNFNVSAGGNIAERLLMSQLREFAAIRQRAQELLERTQVPVSRMDETPANFSGGMQQRVQIAKALATNPPLLLLDEVSTGLDVTVQARILDLILELQQQLGIAMIVVTHDLEVVRLLATRTLVMKSGRVVESGLTDQVLEDPQQAYTQLLVSSAL
jgi:putative phosphonate transport system ATP-binding protein